MSEPEPLEGKHFVFVIGEIGELGGAERQALLLAETVRERLGARVSFLGWDLSEGLMMSQLKSAAIPIFRYPLNWEKGGASIGARILSRGRIAGLIHYTRKTVQPDYLLPFMTHNSKITALIWRRTGARYAWWSQRDQGLHLTGSRLEKWLLTLPSDIVAGTSSAKHMLVERCGVPESRVRLVPNAIPPRAQFNKSEWRGRLALTDADRLLLMAATLSRHKDHPTLFRAFAMLPSATSTGGTLRLALAGRLDEKTESLKVLAKDLGIAGRVNFLGEVSDMDPLYCAADVVVHSSVSESMPNAVLEAMANCRCVIATDIPGISEMLDDEEKELVLAPIGDFNALAARLDHALTDENFRMRAGERNRQRTLRLYSPERLCNEVVEGIRAFSLPG